MLLLLQVLIYKYFFVFLFKILDICMVLCIDQFFQNPSNKADINVKTRDGLTAIHILLARLMYLAAIDSKPIEDRPKVFETDEELQEAIEGAMDCLKVLLEQPSLRYSYISSSSILLWM